MARLGWLGDVDLANLLEDGPLPLLKGFNKLLFQLAQPRGRLVNDRLGLILNSRWRAASSTWLVRGDGYGNRRVVVAFRRILLVAGLRGAFVLVDGDMYPFIHYIDSPVKASRGGIKRLAELAAHPLHDTGNEYNKVFLLSHSHDAGQVNRLPQRSPAGPISHHDAGANGPEV